MTHEESPMPGSRWPAYNKLNCIFRDFCHIMLCWDIFFLYILTSEVKKMLRQNIMRQKPV